MKPKILVKHSRIEVNNYDLGDDSQLEYIFSVWDPVRHQSFPKCIEYNENDKKLILPRGIDIPWLENKFNCQAMVDKKCDEFVNIDPIPIKYLPKDDRQVELLQFILGEGKYKYTKTKSQLSCNSTTGSGKTYVTVGSICYSGSRAIIITSSIEWLNQWRDRILEYTPLNNNEIYTIAGSASIGKLFNRNILDYKIFLASHDTLKSYGDKNGWNKVDELFKYLKCSMKIYDESHLYFDNICKIDFHSNTKKTIYLTATPARSSKEENTLYQLYFKNIPSIELLKEEDAHVNYIAMHFNSHPSPYDINKCTNSYGFDRNTYTNYVVNRPNFRYLLVILINMCLNINGKALIYVGTNQAIAKVKKMIIYDFPFLQDSIEVYTSVNKNNKVEQLYNKIILSTTKSCGAASDITDLTMTINLAEPFKSEVLSRQTLGRCRANNSMYIDVVDQGFYFTKRYYQQKKSIFSHYAKSCKDIVLSDEELEKRYIDITNQYNNKMILCTKIYKE